MRIAFFINEFGLGGAELQVFLLAREMHRRGHDVIVVRLCDAPNDLGYLLQDANIPSPSLGLNSYLHIPPALSAARHILKGFNADVVHSHMFHSNIFTRVLRFFSPFPRLISTAHTSFESGPLRMYAYRLTDFLSDLTTHVSPQGATSFSTQTACARSRIVYVRQVIDTARYRPDPLSAIRLRLAYNLSEKFVFVAVGRLVPEKDFLTLLRAFRQVIFDQPASMLMLVGDGPEGATLRSFAVDTGIAPSVIFLGARSDVPDLLNASDCLVVSSTIEGGPMVLLEALACGKPAVTTDVGIACSLRLPAVKVVPPARPDLLASAMIESCVSPTATSTEGLLVAQQCAPEIVASVWEQLYQSNGRRVVDDTIIPLTK